jgi:hypothetical protein
MYASFRFAVGIWREIVEACTFSFDHPASVPGQYSAATTPSEAQPVRRLLTRADYLSLKKEAAIRPALTVGVVIECAVVFLVLLVVDWWLLNCTLGDAAVPAGIYSLVWTASLASRTSRDWNSLALSNGHLVGPAALFFSNRFVSIPLAEVSLAPLNSRTLASRVFNGRVRLSGAEGPDLLFVPHRYRRSELESFFRGLQETQPIAT